MSAPRKVGRACLGLLLLAGLSWLASCAAVPDRLDSGDQMAAEGRLYEAIMEWMEVPPDSPDHALAAENIKKAEARLSAMVDEEVGAVAPAISEGRLEEAVNSYRRAAKLDPRRDDLLADSSRLERSARLVRGHEERGERLWKEGFHLSALDEYSIILTIIPGYGPALTRVSEIGSFLKEESDRLFKEGQQKLKAGDEEGARTAFLSVLSMDPRHQGARDWFWSRRGKIGVSPPPAEEFILYTIQKGDSLSLVAERFYGDRFKYPMIAEYNGIADPTKISVGQEIRLPRAGMKGSVAPEPPPEPVRSGTAEYTAILLEQAEAFFEGGAFLDSITECKKVLQEDPDNEKAGKLLLESYYRQGLEFLNNKVYEMALKFFQDVAMLVPDYRDIQKLLTRANKALESFIDKLYKDGISFYRDQKLDKALEKWSEVLRLMPDHEGAVKYSEKARLLKEKMEEIKAE